MTFFFIQLNRVNEKMLTKNPTFVDSIVDFLDHSNILENSQRKEIKKENLKFQDFKDLNRSYSKLSEIEYVSIGLASNQIIRRWAEKKLPNGKIIGEVTSANTLHYKTFKPLKGGLFCDRIFGPLKDFECACGNRQRPNQKDYQEMIQNRLIHKQYCPTCDVEYTWSVMRRYQMGYIKLVSPVSHIWYLKANPSYLSILLDIKKRDLENVIYCSETLTLENSWKIVQNFRLSTSPSELFQSWQKILEQKDLKQKKDFLNGYSLKEFEQKKRQSYHRERYIQSNLNHLETPEFENKSSKREILKRFIQISWKLFYQNAYKIAHIKMIKILKTVFLTDTKKDSHKFVDSFLNEKESTKYINGLFYLPLNKAFMNLFMDLFKECLKDSKKKCPLTINHSFLWEILGFFNQSDFLTMLNRKMICRYLIKRIKNISYRKAAISSSAISFSKDKLFNLNSNQINSSSFVFIRSSKCTNAFVVPNPQIHQKGIKKFEFNSFIIRLKTIQACFHKRFIKTMKNRECLKELQKIIKKTSFLSFPTENIQKKLFVTLQTDSFLVTNAPKKTTSMDQSILDLMIFLSDEFVKMTFKYLFKRYLNKYFIKNKLNGSFILKWKNHKYFQEKEKTILSFKTSLKKSESLVLNILTYQKDFKQLNGLFIFPSLNNHEKHKNQNMIYNDLYRKFLQRGAKMPFLLPNHTFKKVLNSKNTNPFYNKNRWIHSMIENMIKSKTLYFLGKKWVFMKNHFLTQKSRIHLHSFIFTNPQMQNCLSLSISKIPLNLYKNKSPFQINLGAIKFFKNIKTLFPNEFSKNTSSKFFSNPFLKIFDEDILQKNKNVKILNKNDEFLKSHFFKKKIIVFSQQFEKNRFMKNLRIPNVPFRNKTRNHSYSLVFNNSEWHHWFYSQYDSLKHNKIKPYNSIKFNIHSNLSIKSLFMAKKDSPKSLFYRRISNLKSGLSSSSIKNSASLSDKNMNEMKSMNYKTLNLGKSFSVQKWHSSSFVVKNTSLQKNHIYSLSFLELWSHDRNWQYFSDYFLSPRDFDDISIPIYKNQTFNTTYVSNEIQKSTTTGAGIILKLLSEFDLKELQKMNQQNRILLDELVKQIRFLRTFVKKGFANKKDKKKLKKFCEKRNKLMRRIKLTEQMYFKKTNPTSMILTGLPVLPPDLRPILRMQNQMASSDLNRLYQRVIYRNDRLKKFRKDAALTYSFEVKYAQRLLQEAVDHLIQNGKGGTNPERDSRGRALKSLSEILKGKQGRFRQYLLGKRVDYSGRSVIVVGPTLKIHECGLPKEMALELFLPFLIQRILHYKFAKTIIGAKTLMKSNLNLTWYLLSEIMQTHPILLNRAPTLHRLGVQAFQAKLIDGRAILLHPLVCPAFNADFDGDQMAVHIPLTIEAKAEAWKLMFSRTHLISSASGEPIMLPSQDMVLGCYYLTTELSLNRIQKNISSKFSEKEIDFNISDFRLKSLSFMENFQTDRYKKWIPILFNYLLKNEGFYHQQTYRLEKNAYFNELNDVIKAYQMKKVLVHSNIWVKWQNPVEISHKSLPHEIRISLNGSWQEIQKKQLRYFDSNNNKKNQYIQTTPGRIFFYKCIQQCIS